MKQKMLLDSTCESCETGESCLDQEGNESGTGFVVDCRYPDPPPVEIVRQPPTVEIKGKPPVVEIVQGTPTVEIVRLTTTNKEQYARLKPARIS
jgi:hypothetical protein